MKYLRLYTLLLAVGSFLVKIQSLPVENQHRTTDFLPEYIQVDLPVSTQNPDEARSLTLFDVEDADRSSVDATGGVQRSARSFGFGGLGGLSGLGGKFGGLGLGFNHFGGLGNWGFGGLHGLGLGGYKPLFGKYFG